MERAQRRLLLTLVAAFGLVVLLLWWPVHEGASSLDGGEATVWAAVPDQVRSVRVERASGVVVELRKQPEGWVVAEPPDVGAAGQGSVVAMLRELSRLERGVPVAIGDQDLAAFGLSPPLGTLTVATSEQEHVLELGQATPVGHRIYVRRQDGQVFAPAAELPVLLERPPAGFADRRLFTIGAERIDHVEVRSHDGRLQLGAHVGEHSIWWVDGWTRADPARVDELLGAWATIRMRPEPGPESVDPVRIVRLGARDGGGEVEIRIGQQTERGCPVSCGRTGWLTAVDCAVLDAVPASIGRRLAFPLELDASERIRISFGGRTLEARREAGGWHIPGLGVGASTDLLRALGDVPIRYRGAPFANPGPELGSVEVWGPVPVQLTIHDPAVPGFLAIQDRAGGAAVPIAAPTMQAWSTRAWPPSSSP